VFITVPATSKRHVDAEPVVRIRIDDEDDAVAERDAHPVRTVAHRVVALVVVVGCGIRSGTIEGELPGEGRQAADVAVVDVDHARERVDGRRRDGRGTDRRGERGDQVLRGFHRDSLVLRGRK